MDIMYYYYKFKLWSCWFEVELGYPGNPVIYGYYPGIIGRAPGNGENGG